MNIVHFVWTLIVLDVNITMFILEILKRIDMTTIKAYTDIEQSKKLTKILPIESADMCYIKHASSDNPNWEFNEDFPPMILSNVPINEIIAETLPCWSLAVLLDVLPPIEGFKPIIDLDINQIRYEGKHRDELIVNNENLIDACVEMIEKLHELDLLQI